MFNVISRLDEQNFVIQLQYQNKEGYLWRRFWMFKIID